MSDGDHDRPAKELEPPDTGPPIPFHVGIKVAWQAYVIQCRWNGKEPNRGVFEAYLPKPQEPGRGGA